MAKLAHGLQSGEYSAKQTEIVTEENENKVEI